MRKFLILIEPLLPDLTGRMSIRIADGPSADSFEGLGQSWAPAVSVRPTLTLETFALDMSATVQRAKINMAINLTALRIARPARLGWRGAPITIWDDESEQDQGAKPWFKGIIKTANPNDLWTHLTLDAEVSDTLLDGDLLFLECDGSGGLGGDPAVRGQERPAGFGLNYGCEPLWLDQARNIGQIDGYGNLLSILDLQEGGSSLGSAVADYTTFGALAAAIDAHVVPPGRWASCIAQGLIGLGAPPVSRVTVNADFGYNRTGALIERILLAHAGISALDIISSDFSAIDVAVDRAVHYWTKDQRKIRDFVQALAGACNASLLATPQAKFAVTRAVASTPVATLDRSGWQEPRVLNWLPASAPVPYWRLRARCARPGITLTRDEVLYTDKLVDRGQWSAATVYRAGNIVWLPDKSSWLYQYDVATAGTAPPVGGAFPSSSSHWFQLTQALEPGTIGAATAADLAALAANFNAANDRNGSPIIAAAWASDGTTIDHTLNADGSCHISAEWSFSGVEAEIDGFLITIAQLRPNEGSSPDRAVAFNYLASI